MSTPPVDPSLGTSPGPSLEARLEPFLRSARDYVKRAIGAELDDTPTSLAFVDHYLAMQRPTEDQPLNPAVVGLLASALGVYFGELCRHHLPGGGEWLMVGDDARTYRLTLTASGVSFMPAALAVAALYNDEVEGWDATVRPPEKWKNMLERVLTESAPIEHDYFFSLTGRFESLERLTELIADFERMTQPGGSPEADAAAEAEAAAEAAAALDELDDEPTRPN